MIDVNASNNIVEAAAAEMLEMADGPDNMVTDDTNEEWKKRLEGTFLSGLEPKKVAEDEKEP